MVKGRPIPTRCVQTGEVYVSLGAALRANGVPPGLWHRALMGYSVHGLLFDPIEADDPDWWRVPRRTRAESPNSRPVRCVETGQTYPSAAAAARGLGVTRNCMYQAINRGCRAGGFHWCWLEESIHA